MLMGNQYPDPDKLGMLRRFAGPFEEWLELAASCWNGTMGEARWHRTTGSLHLTTGGWSGNEDVVAAMEANPVLWGACWLSSHRGGLHVFRPPELPGG